MFEELQRIKKRTGVMFETYIEFDGPETKKYMKSCKELDMIWGKRKNRWNVWRDVTAHSKGENRWGVWRVVRIKCG